MNSHAQLLAFQQTRNRFDGQMTLGSRAVSQQNVSSLDIPRDFAYFVNDKMCECLLN